MKHIFFRNFVLFAVSAFVIVLGLYACKKDILKPQTNYESDFALTPECDAKAKAFVNKVNNFRTQLEKCKVERNDDNINIDSALWNMEALFNTSYSFPERDYVETVNQELTFFIDTNGNDCLSMNTVSSLYDDITNSVRDAYANDGISQDKSLMTVVFEKDDVVDGRTAVKVHVVSGRSSDNNGETPVESGPFKEGDCWYFGEYGGSCDDPSIVYDAAEIIEDSINYYYAGVPVPRPGHRYINHSMKILSLAADSHFRPDGTTYLFHSGYSNYSTLFFNYAMLNHYFNGERIVILHLLPADLKNSGELSDNDCFIQVDIKGLSQSGVAFHDNTITYGDRILVPINEIGPARDLLN